MRSHARLGVGASVAFIGVLLWAVAAAIIEPATFAAHTNQQAEGARIGLYLAGADEMAQLALWGKDLRWAALVLTCLALLVAGARLLFVLGTGPAWVAADVMLDRANVHGWLPALALAAVVGVVLAIGVFRLNSGQGIVGHRRALLILVGGVAAGIAPLTFWDMDPSVRPYVPAGVFAFAIGLSLLFVVLAIVGPLAAAPEVTRRHLLVAGGLLLIVGAPLVWHGIWKVFLEQPEPGRRADDNIVSYVVAAGLAPTALTAILVIGGAWLVGGPPRGWAGWMGFTIAPILLVPVAIFVAFLGIGLSYGLQPILVPATGDRAYFDGYFWLFSGIAVGTMLGCVQLLMSLRPGRVSVRSMRPVVSVAS